MRLLGQIGLIVVLWLGAAIFVAAQTTADDAANDDFFGESGDVIDTTNSPNIKTEYEESFLKAEPFRWGGSFYFQGDINAKYYDPINWSNLPDYFLNRSGIPGIGGTSEGSKLDFWSFLYFSSRPSSDLRFYGRLKISYPFGQLAGFSTPSPVQTFAGTGVPVPSLQIWELYADFNIARTVFFRAGKQTIKWGVGYFFQPADIISLTPVDPNNPTFQREGPLAIKANLPIGPHNLDAYIIAPLKLTSARELAYAARFNLVVGNFELGVGARYQFIDSNRLGSNLQGIVTVSGSLWKFAVFGEGVIKRGTSRRYLIIDTAANSGYGTINPTDRAFFNGTVGFRFVDTQATYLTIIGQYMFNGEGYNYDPGAAAIDTTSDATAQNAFRFVAAGKLSPSDLSQTGRHYIGANIQWDFTAESKVHLSVFWLGNLSDASGFVKPSVLFDVTDEIKVGLYIQLGYGTWNAEYRGAPHYYPQASVQPGLTLNLASLDF